MSCGRVWESAQSPRFVLSTLAESSRRAEAGGPSLEAKPKSVCSVFDGRVQSESLQSRNVRPTLRTTAKGDPFLYRGATSSLLSWGSSTPNGGEALPAWLCSGLGSSRSSFSTEGRTDCGTPPRDGTAPRSLPRVLGDRPSSERQSVRQPDRESGTFGWPGQTIRGSSTRIRTSQCPGCKAAAYGQVDFKVVEARASEDSATLTKGTVVN